MLRICYIKAIKFNANPSNGAASFAEKIRQVKKRKRRRETKECRKDERQAVEWKE
jgi:hypothetical protein